MNANIPEIIVIAANHTAASMLSSDASGKFPKADSAKVLVATLMSVTGLPAQEVTSMLQQASLELYKETLRSTSVDFQKKLLPNQAKIS